MENEKTVDLNLTVKEVDQILAEISKQPLRDVIDLFNKIRTQALSQLQPGEKNDGQVDR